MEFELNIPERIILLNLLPKRANYVTLELAEYVREDIKLKEEEMKFLPKIDEKKGTMHFSQESLDHKKIFDIKELPLKVVRDVLKELDKKEELLAEHRLIYKMFVENLEKKEKEEAEKEEAEKEEKEERDDTH